MKSLMRSWRLLGRSWGVGLFRASVRVSVACRDRDGDSLCCAVGILRTSIKDGHVQIVLKQCIIVGFGCGC